MSGRVFPCASALALACVLSLSAVSDVRADVVVPDDYPTIQAALDANAGPVLVKNGTYDEVLRIPSDATIRAFTGPDVAPFTYPAVRGLSIASTDVDLSVTGLRILGPVVVDQHPGIHSLTFESCRFDSGLVTNGTDAQFVFLRGCIVYGGARLETFGVQVVGCTIIGGGIYANWYSGDGRVLGNYIAGPARWGVKVASTQVGAISANVIAGTDVGIIAGDCVDVTDNDISSCAGVGITVANTAYAPRPRFRRNHVRDCGVGILMLPGAKPGYSGYEATDNLIERSRADGIVACGIVSLKGNTVLDAGRHGIVADSGVVWLDARRNTVLRARGDGMRVQFHAPIDSNVAGHNGGHGIVLLPRSPGGYPVYSATHNTAYANGGSGIVVEDVLVADERGTVRDSVQSNLLVANGRYGLEWTGNAVAKLGCNDYYANSLGMTAGVAPVLGDMSIEPLLCDMARDDVSLRPDSPLLHAPGCGPVGARGVGCAALASAPTVSRSGALAFASAPRPARDGVRFTWAPQGVPARLEVFDVTGARHVDEQLDAARAEFAWDARGADGRGLPAGIYYARLTAGARAETHAVVLLR